VHSSSKKEKAESDSAPKNRSRSDLHSGCDDSNVDSSTTGGRAILDMQMWAFGCRFHSRCGGRLAAV
jgi:hypothetical protein